MENRDDSGRLEELVESLKPQLNALVVCLSHSWGGLEQVAANDSLDLGALGLNVKVLCLEDTPIYDYLKNRSEVSLLPLGFEPRNYFDFKLRKKLHQLLDSGINLIHSHQTSLLGSIVPWVWSRPKIALLATRHIMSDHYKKDFFHRAIYSRLDYLIVVSHMLRRNVLETHSIRERSVKVVNLGLDFEVFNPKNTDSTRQRSLWGADSDTVVIGLVGRIDPAKGQATFIRAAASVLMNQTKPEKVKFVIVGEETLGSESKHLEELQEMVTQFRLEKHVIFTGYQENIPEIMKSFDLFVMPSRQEAFGLVAIEAMAMECPIIISSGGSSTEIVGQDEFGLTVRANDAFDLQSKLRYLLDHPEIRHQMGTRGRGHVVANYDKQKRVAKSLNLYERALRRRSAF
ncbi:MAG: glycosyltransferase family 4 protein [Bdellovibrio sp.]|nr:glycosyltransferase family 4 protein [Bdellovibrio sp.]